MRKLSLQELNRVDVATFKTQTKTPIVLILDNVRSALNVGSAFRTADAFALEKIYLCGITATPPHREILKTAIGATESVDWVHVASTSQLVEQLQQDGYQVWGVEQATESVMLQAFEVKQGQPYALVFG
ncbi:MAG: TrmH family RNA methyltransferase, partial [Bacteroidota bacterium]